MPTQFSFSPATLQALSRDEVGMLLFEASASGNLQLLSDLLQHPQVDPNGLDPHHTRRYGRLRRPLHLACGGAHPDAVALLLGHGADPDARDWSDALPLHLAAFVGSVPVLNILLPAHAARGSLMGALAGRSTQLGTPLSHAAVNQHLDALRCLLRAGAPLEPEVFEAARRQNHTGVLAVLEEIQLEQAVQPQTSGFRVTPRL